MSNHHSDCYVTLLGVVNYKCNWTWSLKIRHMTKQVWIKLNIFNWITQRVFTWDFILGKMKYFQFSAMSISYNCLYKVPWNETHWGFYFMVVMLIEMKFHLANKYYVNISPKWNHPKENIWSCEYSIKTKTVDQKIKTIIKTIFISPAMKTECKQNFFSWWNKISFRVYFI